jgi:hypothetical protein
MSDWSAIIGVVLFILFLPFLVSLLGRMTFALLAFIGCCGALWAALLSLVAAAASAPPDPTEHAEREILLWGSWLSVWIFAGVGIRRKRRKGRTRSAPDPTAFPGHLRGKDAAYFKMDQR